MPLRFNTGMRNHLVDSLTDEFNGGFLEIRTGAQPTNPNANATGTLLASIELPTPCFSFADNGVANLIGIWATTALTAGKAGWARFKNPTDTIRMDVSINSEELSLDFVDVIEGESIVVSAYTVTMPTAAPTAV